MVGFDKRINENFVCVVLSRHNIITENFTIGNEYKVCCEYNNGYGDHDIHEYLGKLIQMIGRGSDLELLFDVGSKNTVEELLRF